MRVSVLIAAIVVASSTLASAQTRPWGSMNIGANLPFSFVYGGRSSAELLPGWNYRDRAERIDANRMRRTQTWNDGATGLEVRCVEVEYLDYPAAEWTVYFKNVGKKDTPIVEKILALDTRFERGPSESFVLHHNIGSPASLSDYAPVETPLGSDASLHLGGAGGRPTNSNMSYFNLAMGDHGTIVVVGWPGQWAADFKGDGSNGLKIAAGQETTHFLLHPGEEVRSPLIVLMDWKGDWIDGQNQWRHWMMAHNIPKPNGKLPEQMMEGYSGRAYNEMVNADEASQIMHIDRYLEEGFKLDYWWMDAGWYPQEYGWPQVGTWEVDTKRFPHGFKPITDHAHARGVKAMVWFEPERVAPNTWLYNNHPEWLLNPLGAMQARRSKELGTSEPFVFYNSSEKLLSWNGIHWNPHSIAFHPGPKGEYSVVRWVAPRDGDYSVDAAFAAIDEQTTTDVHVLHGSASLFDGFLRLNGQGNQATATQSVHLAKGETVDFVVGYGNGDYRFDSTGIQATITGTDGKRHDAAAEYGSGSWSYGWLKPGAKPDSSTFKAYDRIERGFGGDSLLDLGNPKAWTWLVNHVDKLLIDNGIDLYRQDFNIDPLSFWQANDTPDRQGITENKHVMGYLAYWDELRRRHPNMLIDSCASGGRRNDLETMRRSVPLWRSDFAYVPIGQQGMTYGISMWIPYNGTGTMAYAAAPYYGSGPTPVEPYAFWSTAAPSLMSSIDIREKGMDYKLLRHLFEAWRQLGPYYYGDYYPVTPYSQKEDTWIGWEWNRPGSGDGVVVAFRRPTANEEMVPLKLRGLDPLANYRMTSIDGADVPDRLFTGKELMESGLPLTLKTRPAAGVVKYAKVGG